jgi:hypothetical protein
MKWVMRHERAANGNRKRDDINAAATARSSAVRPHNARHYID